MTRFSSKIDTKNPVNCVNQNTITMQRSQTLRSHNNIATNFMKELDLDFNEDLRPFMSTLMMYLGDAHLAFKFKPNLEFHLLLFSKCYKGLVATCNILGDLLKDFELKTAKDSTLITKTSERMNEISMVKFASETLNSLSK